MGTWLVTGTWQVMETWQVTAQGTEVLPQRGVREAGPAANTQTALSAIWSALLRGSVWSQQLDPVILMGPFHQLGIFYDLLKGFTKGPSGTG